MAGDEVLVPVLEAAAELGEDNDCKDEDDADADDSKVEEEPELPDFPCAAAAAAAPAGDDVTAKRENKPGADLAMPPPTPAEVARGGAGRGASADPAHWKLDSSSRWRMAK